MNAAVAEVVKEPIRLDIGCGKNKKQGFTGCDVRAFDGVDKIFHAGKDVWPYADSSVEEINASHFLEHLTNLNEKWERVHFFNESYRVLISGGKLTLAFPHWCSNRYYGDPTHKEPFSEMGFYYLDKNWRASQAPHTDMYTCDYNCTWGYSMHPGIVNRSSEYQQHAFTYWKEAAQDVVATCVARK